MAATDLVPCFYTGQNRVSEHPAELHMRSEVHRFKAQRRGKFVDNGKRFLFAEVRRKGGERFDDGVLGAGNLLPFAKLSNPICKPETINYPVPMAGDRGCYSRHHRHLIHVSGRSQFPQQIASAVS